MRYTLRITRSMGIYALVSVTAVVGKGRVLYTPGPACCEIPFYAGSFVVALGVAFYPLSSKRQVSFASVLPVRSPALLVTVIMSRFERGAETPP